MESKRNPIKPKEFTETLEILESTWRRNQLRGAFQLGNNQLGGVNRQSVLVSVGDSGATSTGQ